MKPENRVSPIGMLGVVVLAVSSFGCGGGASSTPPPPPPSISVSLSAGTTTVQAGATTQITATLTNDTANKGVIWAVSCSTAPCGTVSPAATASGTPTTYTAPTAAPAGGLTVTITATSVADTSKSASVTITVSGTVLPITVSVTATVGLVQVGTTSQFTATVANDPANKGVTWAVSCPAAQCGTILPMATASGVPTTYTASIPQPTNDLQVTLTATSVSDPSVSGSETITVPGISVSVSLSTATVQAGATAQLTATVTNDTANRGVTWTVSCSTAPCGTVSPTATASGAATTYTAPTTPPASDLAVTITAISVSNTSASAVANVTVPAITVSAAPGGALLPVNVTQQFTATVNNDPANNGVTWTLTQGGTACSPACGTISSANSASGTPVTYTAPATVPASPTVTLTATSATDTTKSAGATITISVGTVKLVPDILDFGRVLVNSNSSPQTTTLTNTGNAALSITSIAITGTDAADFSQSDTCATSVGAGSTCTLSTTFKPAKLGLRSANISISDNSADSPQQISLSGTGFTRDGAARGLAARSTLFQERTAVVPIPGGPEKVGTRIMDLVDSTRDDPYLANGVKRELLVRFWYPASLNQDCQSAQYTSPKVWNYFSKLAGIPLPDVTTNSCWNAPFVQGAHPVVVFTPGYTATFTDYTFIFEDLASRGYVVASVGHTYEATALEFPDGRFARSVLGSHLGPTWRGDDQTLSFATSVRLEDLRLVVNELERLNIQADSPFAGKLDMSRVAIAGHSMGGATAFLGVEHEPRFKAGVIIDGFVPRAVIKATQTPVLILAVGREKWSGDECSLWSDLVGPRLAVNLTGAEHLTPSDAVWLAKDVIKTGDMGPEKTIAAIRDYIAAFLDANLRGQPLDPLLTGPSSEYPDAVVTTQEQPLCQQP